LVLDVVRAAAAAQRCAGIGGNEGSIVRYGIITPVVIANPRVVNEWELDAGVDALTAVAGDADRLGYHHLTASNHVAIPRSAAPRRGRRYWDPAVTLGFVAAITRRIRLATYVLVLGYHHPLEIVKRYGTLDVVSGGRLILGVGVGSLEEEFRLLGRDFERRGKIAHDVLRAVQASFGRREPEHHGEIFDFAGVTVEPSGAQTRVPVWMGGRTGRSLRRALDLDCDAWVPFALEPEQVQDLLVRARSTEAWSRRARPLEVGLSPEPPLDPGGAPERVRAEIARHAECGATLLNLRFRSRSLEHHREQLAAFVEIAGPSD
jgi:probable F420-dependent oxidoreductase